MRSWAEVAVAVLGAGSTLNAIGDEACSGFAYAVAALGPDARPGAR